ncbi:LRWD1 protein, partial [Crotophaga sulcirostris]|nr:LRWD1 protein [Crotophaga sulcirostris]
MSKITTELLLERAVPKSTRLRKIETLNLSKLQLKTGDLDPRLFSRLRHLRKLDLSDNLLDKFPNSLNLPDLRVLNCNNNKLEDVTALKQFPLLEELSYENNVFLTLNDDYKVIFLLQNLRLLNGKDITKLANHVRNANSHKLTSKVTTHWEKFFRDQLPENHTAEQVKSIKKEFLKSVQMNVVYGPSSLSEFTRWRVKMIAEQFLTYSLGLELDTDTEPEEKIDEDEKESTESPSEAAEDVGQCALQVTVTPSKRKRKNSKPGSVNKRCKSQANTVEEAAEDVSAEPLHFLQCHSKGNSREDFKTELWSCVFEPLLDSGARKDPIVSSSRTVATCGGESVCLIDCETGTVLKKYKVATEVFFSVAWTTLTMEIGDSQKKSHNILAAAGRRGIVKLIHVAADFCYGEIKAHKKPIATVCFSPARETHLFTASYDKRIALWDIGIPDCDYNFKASQLLMLEVPSVPLRLALVPTCPEQYLLAGCENGCFTWNIKLDKKQKNRPYEAAFQFPDEDGGMTTSHSVDGLAFLNDDVVVSKSSKPGCIFLWSWSRSFDTKGKGCQQTVSAVILAELEWSTTDMPYLTLSTCPAKDYVFCGDEKGSIWMYNLSNHTRAWSSAKGKRSDRHIPPTQILKWPELRVAGEQPTEVLANNVVSDPTLTYLVVVTSVNIIAIWKKS